MIVAVDTGGTKTAIASFSGAGEIIDSTKFNTPKDTDEYIKLVSQAIIDLSKNNAIEAIGIALPGIIEDNVALWCKNLGWSNFDAVSRLRRYFPHTPIFIENDANLAGLSESTLQRLESKRVLYLTISTGVGTGFAQNGQIVPFLRLSEGGQMLVNSQGTLQKWCEIASGRAIYNKYGKLGCEIKDTEIWREISENIAVGLYAIIPLTQPDVIIFGGSVGVYTSKFSGILADLLDDNLPPYIIRPKLIQAAHPQQAVLYGGYQYAVNCLAGR